MATIYEQVEALQTAVSTLQTQVAALQPQALTNGADLNALGVGRYYIPDVTVSATILNKPTTRASNAFIDVVYGATGELQQWYYINTKGADVNNKVYHRYYYDGEWGEWLTGYMRPEDSGWLALPLSSGVTAHNEANFPCRYRKIGNRVFVEGCVKGFATAEKDIAVLPEGYRPSKPFYTQGATNGGNVDTFNVQATTGIIQRVATTLTNLSADNYHFINMEFLTD